MQHQDLGCNRAEQPRDGRRDECGETRFRFGLLRSKAAREKFSSEDQETSPETRSSAHNASNRVYQALTTLQIKCSELCMDDLIGCSEQPSEIATIIILPLQRRKQSHRLNQLIEITHSRIGLRSNARASSPWRTAATFQHLVPEWMHQAEAEQHRVKSLSWSWRVIQQFWETRTKM